MLDLKRLVTFREAARRGSFAAAADALCFTPSAVSQQMSALEREAGAALFVRTTRGVGLTDAGVRLLDHADALLARLAQAEAELDSLVEHAGQVLRFGSFASASASFAAAAVEKVRTSHPSVAISFFETEPSESVARLESRELDVAVVFDFRHPATGSRPGERPRPLDFRWLLDDPYHLAMPHGHPLAHRDPVSIADLRGEVILGRASWVGELGRLCRLAGFEPWIDRACHATGFEALQAFVAAGRGLTLVPQMELGRLRADVTTRPLAGAPVRHVRAATPAHDSRPGLSRLVLEALEQVLGELCLRESRVA